MKAYIKAIEAHLPEKRVTTEDLAREFPEWRAEKIEKKTGIANRYQAAPDECASDLAVQAAEKLFENGTCTRDEIDFVLLCTQSPDYALPTSACIVQDRLGLRTSCGAFDYNLGCSGYIYGLGQAKGLIETGQAKNILLLTAETYTKYLDEKDKSVRTIFGDGATATLVSGNGSPDDAIGPFFYGTDGSGALNLIIRDSGSRAECPVDSREDETVSPFPDHRLFMDGPKIFRFVMNMVPREVPDFLRRQNMTMDDVDLVVFHQANTYILERLREVMDIPEEKYMLHMKDVGNTVSGTVPLALKAAMDQGRVKPGDTVLLAGFGVGYSWGGCLVRWGG